jgi:membrane-bound lytic murein transglycosylase D
MSGLNNFPNFIPNNPYLIHLENIRIVEINHSNINNYFIPNTFEKLAIDEDKFTSFQLKKQLENLNWTTPFHIYHNPTLERYIRVFLKNRRETLPELMDRATYFFPIFEEYLDKYDLPMEIKYLAVIESALNTTAISKSGAKGLWQFMLPTGKHFGLQIDSYIDERYDILKSTDAACQYLSSLYKTFGNWDLALAAYNSGSGNVKKAIKRSGGETDYWKIRQFLPKETRGYLPAFYATFYIFKYADFHQLSPSKSNLMYFETDTIHIKKPLSFKTISKYIPIETALLKALNPQYKKEIIPYSNNSTYILHLPSNLIELFIENEINLYKKHKETSSPNKKQVNIPINPTNSHIVESGENLLKIATKHHITLSQLKSWNGLQTNYLIKGQRLVVKNNK